jgi:hypothetical protein
MTTAGARSCERPAGRQSLQFFFGRIATFVHLEDVTTIDISTIDFTQYQTTPLLTTEATLTLSDDLHAAKPANAPPHVHKAADRMQSTGKAIRQALIERIEQAGLDLGVHGAFDGACDRFWAAGRQRLAYWMIYDHEGLELLDEQEQDELDIVDKREKAEIARELDKHLFGSDGLGFLRKPFAQQVALMASRLNFIAGSEKFAQYEEVIGPDLLATLNILQKRYQRMVHERAMRDDSAASVRSLRSTLQRHIGLYASAVLGMLDEDDPESIAVVLEALRPILNARVRRPRSDEEQGAAPAEGDGFNETDELGDALSPETPSEAELGDDQAE